MRSWFTIDGSLEPIDFAGPKFFRSPLELARIVLTRYFERGSWVLDPFCGFGTTLVAAQELGRHAIGFEKDAGRAQFASSRISSPNRLIHDDARNIASYDLPQFELLLTSPPYSSLRDWDREGFDSYLEDFSDAFRRLLSVMRPGGRVVVELSNVREGGRIRTVLWDAGKILADIFHLEDEMVRCNTGQEEAAPGFQHSTVLGFRV